MRKSLVDLARHGSMASQTRLARSHELKTNISHGASLRRSQLIAPSRSLSSLARHQSSLSHRIASRPRRLRAEVSLQTLFPAAFLLLRARFLRIMQLRDRTRI